MDINEIKVNKGYFTSNGDLVKRFASDCAAPINVTTSWEVFSYELRIYEGAYGTATLWNKLQETIADMYDGNPRKWVDTYYKYRNDIITSILDLPAYQSWNKADMIELIPAGIDEHAFDKKKYSSIWNQDAVKSNKKFVSIDMKSANFQILRHYGIVKGSTYREFLEQYIPETGMLEYFVNSKYTRQVIFGKLNCKRTISLQKKWMLYIWTKYIKPILPEDVQPACISNDEIYIELQEPQVMRKLLDLCTSGVLPFEFKLTEVEPVGYEYFRYVNCSESAIEKPVYEKIGEFYYNGLDNPETRKYKCLDSTYSKLVYMSFMQTHMAELYTQAKTVNMGKSLCEIKDWGGISKI